MAATTSALLDAQVCHVLRIRDGRISHFQQYTDTAAVQWVMGVSVKR
jgi:ketosteroid isomerase-like protein